MSRTPGAEEDARKRSQTAASNTVSGQALRSRNSSPTSAFGLTVSGFVGTRATQMQIAVVDRNGVLCQLLSMPDAWVGSQDIAVARARTAAFFSSDQNALTSRVVGVLSQAHVTPANGPDDSGTAGPLLGIGDMNQAGSTVGTAVRNGLVTFPGGVPLYHGGHLIGAIGVSGDEVDQDEYAAFQGVLPQYLPGPKVVQWGMDDPGAKNVTLCSAVPGGCS